MGRPTVMWGGGGAYQEWAARLEAWAGGDRDPGTDLPRLVPEDFTPDTWARLGDRLLDAVSRALRTWAAELTRSIAEAREEFGVARALVASRDRLRRVRALAAHPGLPPELRERLDLTVRRQVESAQRELERQAWRMRGDGVPTPQVEARLRTLRDNSLTVICQERPGTPGAATAWTTTPAARPRRRVIVDGRPADRPSPGPTASWTDRLVD